MLASREVAQAALPLIVDAPTDIDQVIWTAIRQEIASRPEAFLFETFDWELSQVSYSDDLSSAVVWLDPLDPVTGMTIATEPMAVIVTLSPGGSALLSSDWQVVFSEDDAWTTAAPKVMELLPQELAIEWNEDLQTVNAPEAPLAALGGYRLPWAAGLTKTLVWSAEHTSCPDDDCIYALDFSDGTMFPLLAAKGGTVQYAKDTCEMGPQAVRTSSSSKTSPPAPLPTRSIITWPKARSLQLCIRSERMFPRGSLLAMWMIPVTALVTTCISWCIPAPTPIGVLPWISPSGMCPSTGMPPRRAAVRALRRVLPSWAENGKEAIPLEMWVPIRPPAGLTLPADKQTVTTQILSTSGWGSDNLGVTRMQLIAYYENAWHEVGDALTE